MEASISAADIPNLAEHFASVLAENLSPQAIAACAEEQKTAPKGICALHNVCDPNEYMLQALGRTFPFLCRADGSFDYDPQDEEVGRLMDAAWPLGRYILFAKAEIEGLREVAAALRTEVARALSRSAQGASLDVGLGAAVSYQGPAAQDKFWHCVHSFMQPDAIGSIQEVVRDEKYDLMLRDLQSAEGGVSEQAIRAALEGAEMVIIDSGNAHGDAWVATFHPKQMLLILAAEVAGMSQQHSEPPTAPRG